MKTSETFEKLKVSIVLRPEIMAENEEIKEKIVHAAFELFMKYGIRSVTMDDIARHLGMSKKTIYQSFSEKDEIVSAVTRLHQCTWEERANLLAENSSNAIEEMLKFSLVFRDQMRQMNPSLMYDLFKYHRDSWQDWVTYKSKVIRQKIVNTINRGINEGFFRQDLNVNILATFRVEQIEMAFSESVFPRDQFRFEEVQLQLFDHFVHGCLSPAGMKLYDETKHKFFETEPTPIPVK
jgi:TetR/AcrR family transcriptional regulator, cholesterol catabolism regulator